MRILKFITLFLIVITGVVAQDLSKLTPEQLELYKKYMSGGNITTGVNQSTVNENTVTKRKLNDSIENDFEKKSNDIFGSSLFNKKNLTFEPNLNIPTPKNYVLGTNDEIIVDISGLYDANYKLTVSPDGSIRIPSVGLIKVAGSTIESASKNIKAQIAKVYMGVGTGETRVNITLGNIRSIKVIITGEAVRPGTYTLPSLATAFNALYACGGPSEVGSMRNIQVIRQGKTISNIDIYSFLSKGVMSGDVVLQDGDVINIQPYGIRTKITGGAKRKGKFEMLKGETLEDMMNYAGGFADNAYTGLITVFRLTDKEKTVLNVPKDLYSSFSLRSGDSIYISPKYNKFDNRVDIRGSVYRPGAYSLEDGMTVKQLVAKADGLKEEAYLNVATITRKKENHIPEIISFNIGEVLTGKAPDILLHKDDIVEVRSLFDFREGETVSIYGAVKSPGTYQLIENITLKDLIFKARGFTEMALTDSVELIRVQKNPDSLLLTNRKSTVYKFSLDSNLNFVKGSANMLLQNGDQVIVRRISGYEPVRMVNVEGEVLYPGNYNITNKAERISDVLKRAGGITRYANSHDAFLIRKERTHPVERTLNFILTENIKNQLSAQSSNKVDVLTLKNAGINSPEALAKFDSLQTSMTVEGVANKVFNSEGVVGIDLQEILNNPRSKNNLKLEDGDIIYVPREVQTVRIVGQVLFPTLVRYYGTSIRSYINSAGGFSDKAQRSKVFVLYANGTAKSTTKFLGFNIYPPVKPGSRVIVPEKPLEIKNRLTAGETVSILTSITSVTALVYSIILNSK
jgi:protein involved in polysaccharide export with SLBB domain